MPAAFTPVTSIFKRKLFLAAMTTSSPCEHDDGIVDQLERTAKKKKKLKKLENVIGHSRFHCPNWQSQTYMMLNEARQWANFGDNCGETICNDS